MFADSSIATYTTIRQRNNSRDGLICTDAKSTPAAVLDVGLCCGLQSGVVSNNVDNPFQFTIIRVFAA